MIGSAQNELAQLLSALLQLVLKLYSITCISDSLKLKYTKDMAGMHKVLAPAPHIDLASRLNIATGIDSFLRNASIW